MKRASGGKDTAIYEWQSIPLTGIMKSVILNRLFIPINFLE